MGRGRPPIHNRVLPSVDTVFPTRELDEEETAIWERWLSVLVATRPFLSTDAPLLTFLVDFDIRKKRAREALARDGHYLDAKRHPALTDWDNAHRDTMAALRELGLTPASLKNVNMGARQSKEADALGDFIEGA